MEGYELHTQKNVGARKWHSRLLPGKHDIFYTFTHGQYIAGNNIQEFTASLRNGGGALKHGEAYPHRSFALKNIDDISSQDFQLLDSGNARRAFLTTIKYSEKLTLSDSKHLLWRARERIQQVAVTAKITTTYIIFSYVVVCCILGY